VTFLITMPRVPRSSHLGRGYHNLSAVRICGCSCCCFSQPYLTTNPGAHLSASLYLRLGWDTACKASKHNPSVSPTNTPSHRPTSSSQPGSSLRQLLRGGQRIVGRYLHIRLTPVPSQFVFVTGSSDLANGTRS